MEVTTVGIPCARVSHSAATTLLDHPDGCGVAGVHRIGQPRDLAGACRSYSAQPVQAAPRGALPHTQHPVGAAVVEAADQPRQLAIEALQTGRRRVRCVAGWRTPRVEGNTAAIHQLAHAAIGEVAIMGIARSLPPVQRS